VVSKTESQIYKTQESNPSRGLLGKTPMPVSKKIEPFRLEARMTIFSMAALSKPLRLAQ